MSTEDHPLSFECRRRLYLNIADSLDKWFDRVFRKYIRQSSPGCEDPIYTLHFGDEEPWYVIHRLKLLLRRVMKQLDFNEVYNFGQDELLYNPVRVHKYRLKTREKRKFF